MIAWAWYVDGVGKPAENLTTAARLASDGEGFVWLGLKDPGTPTCSPCPPSSTCTRWPSRYMGKISGWVAIVAVPTMVAGIYGMNFSNMPELGTRYGYYVVLGLIVAVMIGLYIGFKRNKWL